MERKKNKKNVYDEFKRLKSRGSTSKKTQKKAGFLNKAVVIQLCVCLAIFLLAFAIRNMQSPLALQIKNNLSKSISATASAQDVSVFFSNAKEKYEDIKEAAVAVFSKNSLNNDADEKDKDEHEPDEQEQADENQSASGEEVQSGDESGEQPSDTGLSIQNSISFNEAGTYAPADLASYNGLNFLFGNLKTENDSPANQEAASAPSVIKTVLSNDLQYDSSDIYDFDTGEKRIDLPSNVNNDNLILPIGMDTPLYGQITSGFGLRINPVTKQRSFHYGVDIGGFTGEYITAPADGVVEKITGGNAYGNSFIIDHSHGVKTFYGHCDKILVKAGQSVKLGQRIAQVGSTGWSTGPHLHFELYKDSMILNPLNYFKFS